MFANNLYPGPPSVGPDQDPNDLNSHSVPKDFFEKVDIEKKISRQKKQKKKQTKNKKNYPASCRTLVKNV